MPKDPRFNFYPDNYMGGTIGFTLEQHGAYLQLIILQSKLLQFTEQQAIDHIASYYRGNYHGATELFKFLIPKFETNGTHFWNARLKKEMEKSRLHSQKQSERVKKRYSKEKNPTAVLPDNRSGIGNGIENKIDKEGVQGEKTTVPLPGGGKGEGIIQLIPQEQPPEYLQDWQQWGNQIVAQQDQYWEQMKGPSITQPMLDHFLSVATRNDWTMDTAHAFRTSLKGFDFKSFIGTTPTKKIHNL